MLADEDGDPDAPTEAAALGDGARVATGVGAGGATVRPIGSVLMSMKSLPCFTTTACRPFSWKTWATWSAETFGSWNRICQVVPPV